MVDRELSITYQDLLDRQLTEDWVTLCCVSNVVGGDLIGNAWWSGVLVRDLLKEAGVQPGANAVRQTSRDGWDCGTPLAALTDPNRNAMLAIAMNGQPLPVQHGFPVRMVVPGLYGYVSATKWLVDLEVTTFDKFSAFWTERGWSEKGPVKTESRIDVPANGAKVKAGSLRIGGSAWAQHTGIEKVEYQLDGADWARGRAGPRSRGGHLGAVGRHGRRGARRAPRRRTRHRHVRLHADRGQGRRPARRRDRLALHSVRRPVGRERVGFLPGMTPDRCRGRT